VLPTGYILSSSSNEVLERLDRSVRRPNRIGDAELKAPYNGSAKDTDDAAGTGCKLRVITASGRRGPGRRHGPGGGPRSGDSLQTAKRARSHKLVGLYRSGRVMQPKLQDNR